MIAIARRGSSAGTQRGHAVQGDADAIGITVRSHGAKSGVRASTVTATHADRTSPAPSSTAPAQDRRAQPTIDHRPVPASAATAGANALT